MDKQKEEMEYRPIGCMEAVAGEEREVEYVGTRTEGRRRYLLYQDREGLGWYETQLLTENGWEDEETAIFGRKVSRDKRKSRRL